MEICSYSSENITKIQQSVSNSNINFVLFLSDENQPSLITLANDSYDNLRNHIKINHLSFKIKINLTINIANGIKFLHMNGIIHENLNPDNILISDGIAQISNLPLLDNNDNNSRDYFNDNLFNNIGYIDPNSVLNINYEKNKSADIYSLGSLLWEIMAERAPFSKDQDDIFQLFVKIKSGYREVDATNIPEYNGLYRSCWSENSLDRPTIEYVYNQLLKFWN